MEDIILVRVQVLQPTRASSRIIKMKTLIINILALIVSLLWLFSVPGWEPLVVCIGCIATLITQLYAKKDNNGGNGGNVKVSGNNSVGIGGIGGGAGPGGKGGDGGSVEAFGDNAFALGGEGGEAGQTDRGGRGGRSPFEILGYENIQLPDGSFLWDKGRGGDGGFDVQDMQKQKFED